MTQGTIRRRGTTATIGRWQADVQAITVETDDPDLRKAVDSVLATPQVIPVHGAERFEFAGPAAPIVRTPSTIRLLALFALELEARGFEVLPDED
jgi:hypothetical protein